MRLALALLLLLVATPALADVATTHPGDSGICGDARVDVCEVFQGTVAQTANTWTGSSSITAGIVTGATGQLSNTTGMSMVADAPPGSAFTQALRMTAGPGTTNTGGYFFRRITDSSERWVRFYQKWEAPGTGGFHHGFWLGGQSNSFAGPAFSPCCDAPIGTDFFSAAAEFRPPNSNSYLNTYAKWPDMPEASPGVFFGAEFDGGASNGPITTNQWTCVEIYLKANTAGTHNGELRMWKDGTQIFNMTPGSPTGAFSLSNWFTGAGAPFAGFNWRSVGTYGINFLWLQHYQDVNPTGITTAMRWANFVSSTQERIGCLASGDATPPTVPGGVSATALGSSHIIISGAASTDNSGTVANYVVRRSIGGGTTPTTIIASPVTPTYTDSGLTASTVYRYTMAAVDGSGNPSAESPVAQATTQATRQATITHTNVAGEDGYDLFGCVTLAGQCTPDTLRQHAAVNTTTIVHATSGLPIECYAVVSTLTGTVGAAPSNTACTLPPAPILIAVPTAMTFAGTVGAAAPASQSLTIQNGSATQMTWTVSDNANWLSVSPSSGTNNAVLTVTINHTSCATDCPLAAGTHLANVTVSAPGATGTPAVIPITFNLSQASQPGPTSGRGGRIR